MKIVKVKLSKEDKLKREEYLAEKYAERSKVKGDFWWRMRNMITGDGDYVYGMDEGEEPAQYNHE